LQEAGIQTIKENNSFQMNIKPSILFAIFFMLIFGINLNAQVFDRINFEFIQNEKTLKNPLTGGVNSPQLSAVDLNQDGILDLHIFDRVGNIHLTFLNEGTPNESSYVFAPEYAKNFPGCVNWTALRDYNGDGAYDLFTHGGNEGVAGIRVFNGYFNDGKLEFERIIFDNDFFFNVLTYPLSSGNPSNIYVSNVDYADFNDIDGDGDMDILSFNSTGGYVVYYQNKSQEMGFASDSLIFENEDDCWGKFYEADMSEEISLSSNINSCAPNFTGTAKDRHVGSTLLTFDENGDNAREIIIGDVANEYLFRLLNGGDNKDAWMIEQDSEYPSYDETVNIPFFAAAFHLDLNNDGKRDFIASPNERGGTHDYFSIWFYENMATDDEPIFELQQKDLLIDEMLDFGSNSYPTFVDYNADGLLDLVVGTFTIFQEDGSFEPFLFLYENVGSKQEPIFELVDDNWLDYNELSNDLINGSWQFAPTFGDIDDDGDSDLIVGERDGRLIFSENIAGPGNEMDFADPILGWLDIDIGQNAAPQIIDLNRDGLKDIVVGERRGKIIYFPNIGSKFNPQFHTNHLEAPNIPKLGGIDLKSSALVGNLTPQFLDYEDEFKLILGWENSRLHLYEDIENNLDGDFMLVDDYYGKIWEGNQTAIALADLNDNGFLEMTIGNRRGGLSIFESDLEKEPFVSNTKKIVAPTLDLFPNPTSGNLALIAKNITINQTKCLIFNALGQLVFEQKLNQTQTDFNVSGYPSGIYFCQIQSKNGSIVNRFVKE
jgi:hypothetical protein